MQDNGCEWARFLTRPDCRRQSRLVFLRKTAPEYDEFGVAEVLEWYARSYNLFKALKRHFRILEARRRQLAASGKTLVCGRNVGDDHSGQEKRDARQVLPFAMQVRRHSSNFEDVSAENVRQPRCFFEADI